MSDDRDGLGDPYRTAQAPTRPCPRCGIGLGSRHVLDVVLDECASCTGVWVPAPLVPRLLDPRDLGHEVVAAFEPGLPELETAVRYLRCPRCNAMMNRHLMVRGSSVIVDRCAPHGVWFDAHELRRLAELAARDGVEIRFKPELPYQADPEIQKAIAAALIRPMNPLDRGTFLSALFQVLLRRRG